MTMISEISNNFGGVNNTQSKGDSGSVRQVNSVNVKSDAPQVSATTGEQTVDQKTVAESPREVAPRESLDKAVEDLNNLVQSVSRQLEFSVDEESGKTIIKVIDAESGETIRDIPPEEILEMQKHLRETSDAIFSKGKGQDGVSLLFQSKV